MTSNLAARPRRAVKLAVVVQRYGPAINGGAELHARYIAEHLARHAEVEVLTTCATDYVTWRNELPAGVEQVNGVSVRRFRVKHERDPLRLRQARPTASSTSATRSPTSSTGSTPKGPTSPALVDYIAKHAADYDYCLFFSYRYYHAYHGARAAAARAILVPTAERDATIGLSIVPAAVPRRPRADVQLARRTGDDSRRLRQPGTSPASSSASDRTCRSNPQAAPVPAEVQHPRSVRDLRRPDRSEQGLQGAVRVLPALPEGSDGQAVAGARSATRCCRFRSTRASAISAFWTTPTSSTRWPPPSC